MYPLFETLCIENGKIQNIDLHQARYERSLREYYGKSAVKIFNLFSQFAAALITMPKPHKFNILNTIEKFTALFNL